jgi:esterase/lipase
MQGYVRDAGGANGLGMRHRPSGLNSRFDCGHLGFADYVAHMRKIVHEARAEASRDNLETIVQGNAPFELRPGGDYPVGRDKPYRRGILLTHGLTDSPYFMRYLAEFFQQSGFRVMAILLPGHGTRPGDLLDVRWQEWTKAVAYGVDRLAAEADEVHLGGLSCGGALSLLHSLGDERIRGLFLFVPALRISPRAAWANAHRLYSWAAPKAKWVDVMPDVDIYKYESFSKNAAAQMYALSMELAGRLQSRTPEIPIFTVASQDDVSADVSATLELMAGARHPASKLVLYTSSSLEIPEGLQHRVERVNSVVPEQKILSSAHTAIVLPPDDPHYGAMGNYSNCIHYYPQDPEKYAACCSNGGEVWQGEVTERNLSVGVMRRLMYNPNFSALKRSMQRFLADLQEPGSASQRNWK